MVEVKGVIAELVLTLEWMVRLHRLGQVEAMAVRAGDQRLRGHGTLAATGSVAAMERRIVPHASF